MRLTPEELAARTRRNRALAAVLVVFIVLVFTTTILKLSADRDQTAGGPTAQLVVQEP
ncbi:hypothetical protein [Brevundimonas sp.]|uniref:hypothetical protein n=1 Tax=Brevundimonas sp. TaxID=1871086 RepID=UPI002D4233ED|nr:hypothetical protein [Brevundimonas sp.]HYC98268.1 hypothetical protein [Brevundimonas sp.]